MLSKASYDIKSFCDATGIGRSKLYEEIAAGRLRTKKLGKRTLILKEDGEAFLKGLPDGVASAAKQTAA